jgi:hypothetical protein
MRCLRCKSKLPPLNGVEENDFATLCEECRHEDADIDVCSDCAWSVVECICAARTTSDERKETL